MKIFDVFFILSLLSMIIAIILLFVRMIFKKGMSYKRIFTLFGVSIIVFVVSGIFMPELTPEEKARLEEIRKEKELAAMAEAAEEESNKEDVVDENEDDDKENKDSSVEQVKEESVRSEQPVKEEKPEVDNARDETKQNFADLLKEKYEQIDNVLVEDDIAIVIYSDRMFWSETAAFEEFAKDSATIMRELQDNQDIDGIGFVQMNTLTDLNGNESLERTIITYFDKENYDVINLKDFVNQTFANPSGFYKVSNGYWIHPTIYQNVDLSALDGLPFVPETSSQGFEVVSEITN